MIFEGSRHKTLEELESSPAATLAPISPEEIAKAKPKTQMVAGGKKKGLLGDTEKKRDPELLKKYRNMYEQGGLVSTALDKYPLLMLANGYRIEGDPTGEHLAWWNAIKGYSLIWTGISDAINLGDGIQEIAGSRGGVANGTKDIVGIFPRNPVEFVIDVDDKGLIKNYTQVQDQNTGKGTNLKPEQVIHIVLLPQSGSVYGLSLIKRAYDDIIRDTKVAEASTTAIARHGFPKYHIKVGREAELIPDDVLISVRKVFENVEVDNEFITPHDIEIKNIDEGGLEKIEDYNNISLMRVASSVGVPEEVMGLRRGSTDATAVTRVKLFFKLIQTFQRIVEQEYNTKVFDVRSGTPGSVRLVFNDPDPSDESERANWISKIMMASPQNPHAILPIEWVQKVFNIESGELTTKPATKSSKKVSGQKGQEPSTKEQPKDQQPIA